MKKLPLIFIILFSLNIFSQQQKTFYQKDKTLINVKIVNDSVMEIITSRNKSIQIIKDFDATEKEIRLAVDDYNFDGYEDFAIHQADAGWGVYEVYSLYIFDYKTKQFKLLDVPENPEPNCIYLCDLKIDKKNKRLISSCRGGAKWHKDYWVFNKKGKMVLFQKTID
jgi:hypothetical protein